MGRSISPRLSVADSTASDGSHRDAAAPADGGTGGGAGGASRSFKSSQAASIAAVVESTNAHRALVPGLAELVGGSGVGTAAFKSAGGSTESHQMHATAGGDGDGGDAMETEPTVAGHPHLPSMEAVSSAASRLISEYPPFITMSARDTAPQLKLEDPPAVDGDAEDTKSSATLQRKLVVKGGMKGYRMSRASHGVSSGCYYYEAVVLGSDNGDARGVKRSFKETEEAAKENDPDEKKKKQTSTSMNGHLRIGWSTPLADLQGPVGYNEHSYAIRDIGGSRIHKSRREDNWGGVGFGSGDVLGVAICLVESKPSDAAATTSSLGNASSGVDAVEKTTESGQDGTKGSSATDASALTNHIRFFKNGQQMGGGIAFDNITPGTYHPSVSCYMDGAAQLNFGPHFIYPPRGLPSEISLRPISDLCASPPLPEEAVEKVISGGSKEGKKIFSSKRTDDSIVSAFKELVKMEATVRREANLKHLDLHRKEVAAFRKERGLSTLDLTERP